MCSTWSLDLLLHVSVATLRDEEDESAEVDPQPVSAEELNDIAVKTPSHWDHIEPRVPKVLPLSDGGNATPHSDDLAVLAECYLNYPFHTSQSALSIRKRLVWKARRGGDMATIAGG
jgi:hypothetical protein